MQNYCRLKFRAIHKSGQLHLAMKTYTFGYGTHGVIVLILQQIKPRYYEQYSEDTFDVVNSMDNIVFESETHYIL